MQETYRWGILAPGKIAHKFATGLKLVPGAQLQAIGSRNLGRAQEFAAQYHAQKSYGSYEELAADPEVDVIYIATPHSFHMENSLLCLQHGKAVLCEKPLAINSRQVQAMIDASRQHNTFLMEALWSRFLPNILKAKELLDSEVIGKARHLEVDFGFEAVYDPESRLFNPALGGGALLDIGIYPLFFAVFLFGIPSLVESEAEFSPTGVDQSCRVKLTFASGVTADLWFTLTEHTAVEARIKGDQGEIMLPNRWYQPVNVLTNMGPEPQETIIDFVGNGYNYQALEVQKCLSRAAIESDIWSHQNSLGLMQLMDQIRQQIGLVYPEDGNNQ